MSFIEIPLDGVEEEKTVPEGVFSLRVDSVTEAKNEETGREGLHVFVLIENPPDSVPNPASIFHYLGFPIADDDDKTRQFMLIGLKRFLFSFNVPFENGGFNTEDLPGATAEVLLGEEMYDGRLVNKMELPLLPDEG